MRVEGLPSKILMRLRSEKRSRRERIDVVVPKLKESLYFEILTLGLKYKIVRSVVCNGNLNPDRINDFPEISIRQHTTTFSPFMGVSGSTELHPKIMKNKKVTGQEIGVVYPVGPSLLRLISRRCRMSGSSLAENL